MNSDASTLTKSLLVLFFLALVTTCLAPEYLEFSGYLLFGWIAYLKRVVPQTQVNWAGVGSAVISLVGALLLGNVVARWLWREMHSSVQQPLRSWKLSWTAAGALIVMLMFVAGIAAVGITHQSVWLAKSDRPLFRLGRESANRVKCSANLKSLGQVLQMYAKEHEGSLPDSIEELAVSEELMAELFVCPSSDAEKADATTPAELLQQLRSDDRHCSYVYHGRGLKMPLSPDQVILCEPLSNHSRAGVNVLFGSMDVEWLSPAEAEAAVAKTAP